MNNNLTSVSDLFKTAWERYTKNFWSLIGVVLISGLIAVLPVVLTIMIILIVVLSDFNVGELLADPENGFILLLLTLLAKGWLIATVFGLAAIASLVLSWWSKASQYVGVSQSGGQVGFKDSLKKGWHYMWSYLWITILMGLAIFGGLVLLVIPGIIFAVWFIFSIYILVSEDLRGVEALKRSKALVKGRWWEVFGRLLAISAVVVGLYILVGLIPVVNIVAPILVSIYALVYTFVLYEDLKRTMG